METLDERRWEEEKRVGGLVGAEGHLIVRLSTNQSIPMNLVTCVAGKRKCLVRCLHVHGAVSWLDLTFTHTLVSVNTFWCQRFVTSIVDGDARRCKPEKGAEALDSASEQQ